MSITVQIANASKLISCYALTTSPQIVNQAIKLHKPSAPVIKVALYVGEHSFLLPSTLETLIAHCPDLQEVDFSGCWIDKYQLSMYADVMGGQSNSINSLAFRENQLITMEDLECLDRLPNLKKLDLNLCLKVSDAIHQKLPNLDIKHGGFEGCEKL